MGDLGAAAETFLASVFLETVALPGAAAGVGFFRRKLLPISRLDRTMAVFMFNRFSWLSPG